MNRRSFFAVLLFPSFLGVASWNGLVAEYFGRVDLSQWEQEHPSPPPPPAEPGRHDVELTSTRQVVPSEGLPAATLVQTANNNLDVIRHQDGRVYLAFRTAPSHFASAEVVMQILSSADEQHWRHEGSFSLQRDLREPVFLSLDQRLLLYVARLGTNAFNFEPDGMSVTERGSDGKWSALRSIDDEGRIPWRIRFVGERPVMVAYRGGENLYEVGDTPLSVELLTTEDGWRWTPFNPERPVVARGGGSETDFVVRDDGSLFAIMRNEAGDESGYGSKLCRAPAHDITAFDCTASKKKYDSPLTFEHDGEVYVIARRNLTADGNYDVASGPRPLRTLQNQLSYITTAKRCSLFRYIEAEDRLGFILDLPSRGDTCFPAMIAGATPSEIVVYNYSSDVEGPELPWAAGQRRNTYVYRHTLVFHRRSR